MDTDIIRTRAFKRTKYIIDREFQYSYMLVWLLVGFGMVAAAIGGFFLYQHVGGIAVDQRVHAMVKTVAIGMSIFVILFCILMGIFSVFMTHRVAGAAYRIKLDVDRMLSGERSVQFKLRKGDYLRPIAEDMNKVSQLVDEHRLAVERAAGAIREVLEKGMQDGTKEKLAQTLSDLERVAKLTYNPPHAPN